MTRNMALIGLCIVLTACQTSEPTTSKQQKLNASETTPKTTEPSTKTTPPKALPNTGWQVKRQDTSWFIEGHNTRLCLPEGLYQHNGLAMTIDGSTIQPPKPNVRQACLQFDTSTIKLTEPVPKTSTFSVRPRNGVWVNKERVAIGPAADGVRIQKLCIPKDITQLKELYIVEGYPAPAPKDMTPRERSRYKRQMERCVPYVFTSIKGR